MKENTIKLVFTDNYGCTIVQSFKGFENINEAENFGYTVACELSAQKRFPFYLSNVELDDNNWIAIGQKRSGCYDHIEKVAKQIDLDEVVDKYTTIRVAAMTEDEKNKFIKDETKKRLFRMGRTAAMTEIKTVNPELLEGY